MRLFDKFYLLCVLDLTKTGYAAHMFSMSFAMFYMKAIDTGIHT